MEFGDPRINLRPADADPDDWMTADPPVAGSADLCFITASLPKEVMAHLKVHGVEAIEGPVSRSGLAVRSRPSTAAIRMLTSLKSPHTIRSRDRGTRRTGAGVVSG